MDSLGSFAIFVRVAETRSFAAAGRLSGISASAVSKAIARLEEKLGARLLNRSTRSVSLTGEGALFLERCRRILSEIEMARLELSDTGQEPRGRLRVSLPLVSGLMLPVLSEFARRYPQIELDLDFTNRLVDVIDEGFDAVVRTGELGDSRLMSRQIGKSRFLYVGSPRYFEKHGVPASPDDLREHLCLQHRFPTSGLIEKWPISNEFSVPSSQVVSPITSNHIETLLYMAIEGHGIARLPDFSVRDALTSGKLLAVLDAWSGNPSTFWVLWPPNRQLSARVRAFIGFIGENLLR